MTDSKIEVAKALLTNDVPPGGVAKNIGVLVPRLFRCLSASVQT